uniref:Prominin 2 n=1 Tax=Myripristis murdjan TaxID=586833 RepID=A0A667Y7L1_9TELE
MRCQGGAGAFRAAVGVLLLGFSLAQSTVPQPQCPKGVAPHSLNQPHYLNNSAVDTGVGFMKDIVQSFLHTVQPNPFPQGQLSFVSLCLCFQALQYEVGFLVCAAIGIIYIVLMPLVGFFLACCRCCGNCGGKMHQEQTSGMHCRRRALYWSTFITTLIILAGNICMFKSNEALKVSVDKSAEDLNITIDNLHIFLGAVYLTLMLVLLCVCTETISTSNQLRELNSSLARLQSSVNLLQANVSDVKNRINRTSLNPNCINCGSLQPELQKLTLDTTITTSSLTELQSGVDEVIKADLKSQIRKVEDYFSSIPQRVTNDTKDVVQSTKQQLEEIKTQISQVKNDIPLSALSNVSDRLDQLQREIGTVTPTVDTAEYIRWTVCVALCCVVLLVVVCNILGLLLGPLGLKPKADPADRSCTANCGGTFLMMGAGFSFLFGWLFMIVVLLLFLLGGNVYTLVCQPWDNGELLKFIDTEGVIPGFQLGPMLGLKSNLTLTDIYSDCEKNRPLWSTLRLYELVDLEDLLNVSKVGHNLTSQFTQLLSNTDITLSTITFLSPDVQNQLSSFSAKADGINNISSINLNTTADKLEELATVQTNDGIKAELRAEARDLRQIQTNIEITIIPQLVSSSAIVCLGLVSECTHIYTYMESREFLDCQMGYFTAFADWANGTVNSVLAKCCAVTYCAYACVCFFPCNAFWFSLGWCLIFFIPSIIFSIKLAKYYRRMDSSDVYDNHIIMNHIPRAQMKPY